MTSSFQNSLQEKSKPERRYDLDWLRVLAVLLLIPFHAALVFGSGQGDSWLKDQPVPLADLFAHFVHQWHMPLLFILSGMATWFALGFRTAGQYRIERFKRLLVPLVLLLLFYPWQAYYWFLSYADFQGSFLEFYPIPFISVADFGLAAVWGHMWFLVYLFIYSLLCLPLFLYLRGEAGQALIGQVAGLAEKWGGVFLLAVPLVVSEMIFRASWGNTRNLYGDWANFSFYLICFIYGYGIAADSRFRQALVRHSWLALGLGMVTFMLSLPWMAAGNPTEYAPHQELSPGWYLYLVRRGFNSWFWLVAVLGLGQKYLNVNHKVLAYLGEASMSIYILHLPLCMAVSFYVIQWDIDLLSKFLLINLGTVAVTFLVYDLVVKRTNFTRFLFGMRPKKKPAAALARQPA